jgi:regulator of RNase E activity RraA
VRPSRQLLDGLAKIGSATASGELHRMGIRSAHLQGLNSWTPGVAVAGPALTLQCMPLREDIYTAAAAGDPERQPARDILYKVQPGDLIVIDARGDLGSGMFGDMMLTFFKARGGRGVVVDGCIRDYPMAKQLGIGLWLRGVTPNFGMQTAIFPYAVNVPVACGGVLVMPGDVIVADDDGAVVVPAAMAEAVLKVASEKIEWEEFSRTRLSEGGDLRKYYPLSEEARPEFEAWRDARIAD